MTTFDVIIEYDKERAKILYKFLKNYRCIGLLNSNLHNFVRGRKEVLYAYRIRRHSSPNRYEYCYSLSKNYVETPVMFDKFIERTFKL